MLSERQLTDMAKKGAREYRKALAYAGDKWNIKECTPKESGTSVEDVIEYVRRRMYYDSQKKKGIISDVDNESVLFDEMNNENKKNKDVDSNDESDSTNEKNNNSERDNSRVTRSNRSSVATGTNDEISESGIKCTSTTQGEKVDTDPIDDGVGTEGSDDNDEQSDMDIDSSDDDNYEKKDKDDSDEDEDDESSEDDDEDSVPYNYMFPSYIVFVLWGPFVEKNEQLTLFLLGM